MVCSSCITASSDIVDVGTALQATGGDTDLVTAHTDAVRRDADATSATGVTVVATVPDARLFTPGTVQTPFVADDVLHLDGARFDVLVLSGLVGDMVLSESLNWMNKTEAGIAAGEVAYDDGRIYKLRSHVNPCARNFVHHQSTFYRRSLFAENDAFDTSLAVMADYEFNVRLWKNRVRFKPIPLRIAACGTGGLSDSGRWRGYREEIAVRHRYFAFGRCLVWDALSVVRYVRKKIVRLGK